MFSIKFSIGYNHDLQLLKLVENANEYIESFYFPVPNSYMGSGRALPQPESYKEEIKKIIQTCKNSNVKSLMLLNATAGNYSIDKIIDYVKSLKDLDGVIAANPVLMPKLKALNLEIHSSVNCYTKTAEQALDLKDLGVDFITIDRDINRDLSLIKEIKQKTKLKLKALVNEGCLRNCPFRQTHFNLIAEQIDTREFDKQSCITVLRKHPEKFFQIPFIRPEDLKYYKGLIDHYKIASRTMDSVKIGLILDAYVNEKFEGDLLFLLAGKGIFEYFDEIDSRKLGNDFFKNMTGKNSEKYAKSYLEAVMN